MSKQHIGLGFTKTQRHKETPTAKIKRRNKNTIRPFSKTKAQTMFDVEDYEVAKSLGIHVTEVRSWSNGKTSMCK